MQRAKLTAIVLRTVDTGESDRVVTLLSRERGKVAAFARGARASRRRFGGALEPFTLLTAEVRERPGALLTAEVRERPGAELLGLDAVTVLAPFGAIRGDLARIACAAYAAELARELVRDHEPHDELFALLAAYLALLDAAPARPAGLRAFELGALRAAGLAPRLDACARCGGPLAPGRPLRLDPGHGGVLCAGCVSLASPAAPSLAAESAAALLRLAEGGLVAAETERLAPPAGREVRDALAAFLEHHLGHRLAARRFLDDVASVLGE